MLIRTALAQFEGWHTFGQGAWKKSKWKMYAVLGLTPEQGTVKYKTGNYIYSYDVLCRIRDELYLDTDNRQSAEINYYLSQVDVNFKLTSDRNRYDKHGDAARPQAYTQSVHMSDLYV